MYTKTTKPSWDTYFIHIANAVSKRSPDPKYKVGAVIVSSEHIILGTGYNGFPVGFDESTVDWFDRNTIRPHIIHAEKNALDFTLQQDLNTARMYITLSPCDKCIGLINDRGIKNIMYRDIYHKTIKLTKDYCFDMGIMLVQYKYIHEDYRFRRMS